MNILFISTTYPTPVRPHQGKFNLGLVNALSSDDQVRVIAPIPWPQRLSSRNRLCATAASKQVGAEPGLSKRMICYPTFWYPPKVWRTAYARFYWSSIKSSIRELSADGDVDLVVGYWLHPDGLVATDAAEALGVPCVLISGGSDLKVLTKSASRQKQIITSMRRCDRLVVVSKDLYRSAVDFGIPEGKIDLVYRGVDRAIFHPLPQSSARKSLELNADSVVVFWAGRLEAVKNPFLLLSAAKRWKERWGKKLVVAIAGDGSQRKVLEKSCCDWNLHDVVHFQGNLPSDQLMVWFNAADVTALTSHSEGVPNVLLESIACATPFVATDVGGVNEIATPGVDYLVRPDDSSAFSEAVFNLMDRARDPQSAATARSFVPASNETMALQYRSIFQRTIAARKSPEMRGSDQQSWPRKCKAG
jgi:glycosyltransferase involved in cell wall biosynthesis